MSHHYKSQCSQVYNYHRLLSWDQERGLHMDIYKVVFEGRGLRGELVRMTDLC